MVATLFGRSTFYFSLYLLDIVYSFSVIIGPTLKFSSILKSRRLFSRYMLKQAAPCVLLQRLFSSTYGLEVHGSSHISQGTDEDHEEHDHDEDDDPEESDDDDDSDEDNEDSDGNALNFLVPSVPS